MNNPEDILPDYRNYITRPLYISKIQSILKAQKYKTVEQWRDDVNQMFSNCIILNTRESEYGGFATYLQNKFRKIYKEYFSDSKSLMKECIEQHGKLEKLLLSQNIDEFKILQNKQEISLQNLQESLSSLTSQDDMINLMYILKQSEPDMFEASNEIEVDLEKLKPETIEKLQKFVLKNES